MVSSMDCIGVVHTILSLGLYTVQKAYACDNQFTHIHTI